MEDPQLPPPYSVHDDNPTATSAEHAVLRVLELEGKPLQPVASDKRKDIIDVATKIKINPKPDLGPSLHEAVCSRNRNMVQILLQNGACANTRPRSSKPTLTVAVKNGDVDIVKMLLERAQPDMEARASGGPTALYEAVKEGNTDIVRLLLSHGANVNAKPGGAAPALCKAYSNGYMEVFRMLLDSPNIIVDATPPGDTTILWHAAKKVDRETVKALLSKGANVEAKAPGGTTALWLAATRGDRETASELLQHGAKVDVKPPGGNTALWEAVSKGNENMVKLLMFYGADMHAKGSSSETALTKATKNGNSDLVRILLEYAK